MNAHVEDFIDRIILAPERRVLVPYSDMQIWRMENEGKFPRRIRLGPNRVGPFGLLQPIADTIKMLT